MNNPSWKRCFGISLILPFMAAKNGRINEIPKHLFQLGLFMAKNNRDETPLHFAAHHGHLAQVPKEFLTRETLIVLDCDGRMPLHVAAAYGHLDQIPKEFLTPDLLGIPTQGTKDTVLHYAALSNQLDRKSTRLNSSHL